MLRLIIERANYRLACRMDLIGLGTGRDCRVVVYLN